MAIENVPTMKIVNPKKASEFLTINVDDFDTDTMVAWEDREAPKKAAAPKPKKKEETDAPDHRI